VTATPACPACGSPRSEQVGRTAPGFTSTSAGHTLRQPDYAIRQCEACDLYFKSPAIDPDSLPRHYAGQPFEIYEHGDTFPTERVVREWLDRLPRGSKVLDFGCSTGRTLKGMSGRLTCIGVELNTAAAAVAAERGIRIVAEEQLGSGDLDRFDAIVLSDVFEHLPRPSMVLGRLASLLAPGGWLAIVTGNADAIRHREWLSEFWYFRGIEHLHMASEKHLHWLANHLALQLESFQRCSHYKTPAADRMRQFLQEWAYGTFVLRPNGLTASALRMVPRLKNAESWTAAPALTYRRDHLVARLARRRAGENGAR
jgi:SAM-dependent methyltransferase